MLTRQRRLSSHRPIEASTRHRSSRRSQSRILQASPLRQSPCVSRSRLCPTSVVSCLTNLIGALPLFSASSQLGGDPHATKTTELWPRPPPMSDRLFHFQPESSFLHHSEAPQPALRPPIRGRLRRSGPSRSRRVVRSQADGLKRPCGTLDGMPRITAADTTGMLQLRPVRTPTSSHPRTTSQLVPSEHVHRIGPDCFTFSLCCVPA